MYLYIENWSLRLGQGEATHLFRHVTVNLEIYWSLLIGLSLSLVKTRTQLVLNRVASS
jgi:hypothetical protein